MSPSAYAAAGTSRVEVLQRVGLDDAADDGSLTAFPRLVRGPPCSGEGAAQLAQVGDGAVDVGDADIEQPGDFGARPLAAALQVEDVLDLAQGQPERLGLSDELENGEVPSGSCRSVARRSRRSRGPESASVPSALEAAGRTVIAVSRDGRALGLIALGDEVRAEAPATVAELKRQGIVPVLVTGDNRPAAQRVAAQLGIEQVHAEVLPDGKAEIVRELQHHGRVAMVGDGINDAPALTQADVGVAMGAGTEIAIESSDIIIVGDRLDALLTAHEISGRSYRKTKQNVALAFLFNGVGLPLAATGLLYPIWAMLAMVASVTAVFLNSLPGNVLELLSAIASVGRRPPVGAPAPAAQR